MEFYKVVVKVETSLLCDIDRFMPYETMMLLHRFLQLDIAMNYLHQQGQNKQS